MDEKMTQNLLLPDVRILGHSYDWEPARVEHLARYESFAIPRVGDRFQVQYWLCEVYNVIWCVVSGRPCVDVYCDMTEAAKELNIV